MIDFTIAEKKVNATNKNKTGMVGRHAGQRMNSSLKARSWKNVVARVSGDSPAGLTAAAEPVERLPDTDGCVFTDATAENAGGDYSSLAGPGKAGFGRFGFYSVML
jgi:hypothetical protein